MGSPCEPLTPRQEMIAELEGYGYDLTPNVPKDWRDTKSDADLAAVVEAFSGGKDTPELPDISEIVEAIREMVGAFSDWSNSFAAVEAQRVVDAHARLKALLTEIDAAMEASFA